MGRFPAQHFCRLAGRLRARLSAERGVTLIETLVSAVILVIVIGAVMTTIDVSSRTTAVNRTRSVAASLAEQDQERLRGLSATALSNYHVVKNQPVGNNVYTVDSDTDWVYDATGSTASCSNAATQASYLRISSTVTSAVVGTRVKPVVIRSLVAPRVGDFGPNQGTLAVLVKNQVDGPVANMPVTVSGPYNGTEYTNEFGCAVFGHIPIGSYVATLNQAGWVNPKRIQVSTQNTAISDGNTTAIQMSYAQASAVEVSFETKVGGVLQPARGHALTVANASVPAQGVDPAGVVTFSSPTAPAPASMIPAPSLYPFPDGYAAYAGDCAANDPAVAFDPDYFTTYPTGFTNVTPGATATAKVRVPAFNIQTKVKLPLVAAVPMPGANVVLTLTSAGCAAATNRFVFTTSTALPAPLGTLPEPGLPFGTYTACVDDGVRKQETVGIDNTDPDGLALESDGETPQLKLTLDYRLPALGGSPLGVC